jgi:anhydro-N-acetylmuramic acid kinase
MRTPLNELAEKESLHAIGIMSGTSCDGVDICAATVSFQPAENVAIEPGPHATYPYPAPLSDKLMSSHMLAAPELSRLSFELGLFFSNCINRFLKEHDLPASDFDVVGSHGHTVVHKPPPSDVPSTLQIGEASSIREGTGITVVSDFRVGDIAAGGQGAPLVPLVDYFLFRDIPEAATLNIGGIANVTVIGESQQDSFAFDTGPGNCLIDRVVRMRFGSEVRFDRDGELAARGRTSRAALDALLENRYFDRAPPKSLDREEFADSATSVLIDMMRDSNHEDVIATATEFTARTIHRAFQKFVFPEHSTTQIIVSGGGVHNPTLLRRLEDLLRPVRVVSSKHFGVDPDAKEALAFAVLAGLCVAGLPGNILSATGARHPVVLGKITQ